jgi:sucrose-6-phosphate hydrolase SacC (GH32 family)
MKYISIFFAVFCTLSASGLAGQAIVKRFEVTGKYLNFPIGMKQDRQRVHFVLEGDTVTFADIRLADSIPDYWVFKDVSAYRGMSMDIVFAEEVSGIEGMYLSDRFAGEDSLYAESNRPQFHFTTRRGWNNDPNGLVYHDSLYHLFYQHNPYEIHWGNMHWGHAVSRDLLHWEELGDALYPDHLGTMYSGSAVVDKENTAGWGKDALVLYYTAAGKEMTQNVAYSTDNGITFTKYAGNPVLGPNRDPKVFWHGPSQRWVMALYEDNFIAIYNSTDLKSWVYQSKTKGFYECHELFELAVDGDVDNTMWVMYGASGTYMLGTFDGAVFEPAYGKYFYSWGSQYAAQTFNNTPDGRRIQVGWGRIEQPGMPFNQMMLFPCELSLRTTPEGVRLFCAPVREIEALYEGEYRWQNLGSAEANELLQDVGSALLHVKMDVGIEHGHTMKVLFGGSAVLEYDGNFNRFDGAPYSSDQPGGMRFNIEMLIDRTSVEYYIDGGKLFVSKALRKEDPAAGLHFGGNLKIYMLEVAVLSTIWSH